MNDESVGEQQKVRFSASLVTQGKHRFVTLTMPSDVLANCSFVSTREEDPESGFQRYLDKKRAQEIATYIDQGFGTIPNSVVLSAQPEAALKILGRGKTIEFIPTRKAFLILDGQHRVYGFKLAKTLLRVPVVIYSGLTRQQEASLFIDINTKQRPVPNELLLDIKRLADKETDTEHLLRQLFDQFKDDQDGPLYGLMSPFEKATGKITRVTFNSATKPLLSHFATRQFDTVYPTLRAYLLAFVGALGEVDQLPLITNPTVFRAVMDIFPAVTRRVRDKHGSRFSEENFVEFVGPMLERMPAKSLKSPGTSYRQLADKFLERLNEELVI